VDREPQDTAQVFAPTIHAVYYFTEVHGAEAPTTITHRWSYKDQVMAEVKLPVESSPWRTWSSKTILPEWTGAWKVEALTEAGQVLTSKTFTVIIINDTLDEPTETVLLALSNPGKAALGTPSSATLSVVDND